MRMTREEAIRNFREHWASLAITGSNDKEDYLRRHGFPHICCNCFLCEYAEENDIRDCDKCPVEWPVTNTDMDYKCDRSFYGYWERAKSPEERKRLAAIIRDLPEKKEVKAEPKLKVGDRVRVKSNGRVGTIKGIQDKWPPYIGVEFDEPIFNGHNFNDHLPKGKDGHCYFYNEGQLELLPINHCPEDKTVPVQTITIKFKGPETICTIKNQFGTFKGKAKCHPTDQWNEKTGADLALGRAAEKFNEYQPDV
jgi:hypothetical protein